MNANKMSEQPSMARWATRVDKIVDEASRLVKAAGRRFYYIS